MNTKFACGAALALSCGLGLGKPVHAEITVVRSVQTFEAVVGEIAVDGYNGFSIIGSTPSPLMRSIPPYAYTASAADVDGVAGSFFGAGTTADPWLSLNTATHIMTLDGFAPAINAIGGQFFASNQSGAYAAGDIVVEVVDSLGDTETLTLASPLQGDFVGFISDGTITSLKLSSVQPASGFIWPTLDNLRVGTVAPAPEIFLDGFETLPVR